MENSNVKKTAVVIGGSSGIGFETCLRLSNRGWNVINISRTPCKIDKVENIQADVTEGTALTDIIRGVADKPAQKRTITVICSTSISSALCRLCRR